MCNNKSESVGPYLLVCLIVAVLVGYGAYLQAKDIYAYYKGEKIEVMITDIEATHGKTVYFEYNGQTCSSSGSSDFNDIMVGDVVKMHKYDDLFIYDGISCSSMWAGLVCALVMFLLVSYFIVGFCREIRQHS